MKTKRREQETTDELVNMAKDGESSKSNRQRTQPRSSLSNFPKPKITYSKKEGNKIVLFETTKTATAIGDGSHIILPKELIGKDIKIFYKEESK